MRPTAREALANAQTVLQLCAAGWLRCSEKTARPAAATAIGAVLQVRDFSPDEPVAAFAWRLLVQTAPTTRRSSRQPAARKAA